MLTVVIFTVWTLFSYGIGYSDGYLNGLDADKYEVCDDE